MVGTVTVGRGHGEASPERGVLGARVVSAARGEQPAAGVHADQRPGRVREPATVAIPVGGRDEHGQRVPQLVSGVAELSERVRASWTSRCSRAGRSTAGAWRWRGAASAAPSIRAGPAGGDAPIPEPVGLVLQRGADHRGGVGAPRLQRGRQQDVGWIRSRGTGPAAGAPRRDRRGAHGAFAPYPQAIHSAAWHRHSFFDRKQEDFAEASDDAWRRTLAFIDAHR